MVVLRLSPLRSGAPEKPLVGVEQHEILPLLDAIGDKGVYILTSFANEHEAECLMEQIAHRSSR